MKLHRPIAEQVVRALESIFIPSSEGRTYYADKVIERIFKHNRKLGARDRRFIAETTYGIVRWWRLILASLDVEGSQKDLWKVLGAWLLMSGETLPPWPEFNGLDAHRLHENRERANANPAIRESVPDWLFALGQYELGSETWLTYLAALNEAAPVILRANRLKATRDELKTELSREGIETTLIKAAPDAVQLTERRNVFTTETFRLGHFEVQDGASQAAAPLLKPEPGHRVIDGCAGAGGKTLHLAALMGNKGKIIAMDIHQTKIDELRKRCSRAGVDIVETRAIESNKTVKRLEKTADRVLLDVPCSGLGVLRRNPDSKWKLTPEDLPRLRSLQSEILATYSQMLKPGGRLVYATCSVLPSENEQQVQAFLAANPESWRFVEEHKFIPGVNGFDGFYAAAIERLK